MRAWILPLAAVLAVLPLAARAADGDLRGRVIGITDGDTLTVLTAARAQVRVRLVGIDAPEHGQPYGDRARQALSALAYLHDVRVAVSGRDRYGRTLGRVWDGGLDVNAAMVERGAAWAWREEDPQLAAVEQQARAARRGLWALSATQIEAPWVWRDAHNGRALPSATPSGPTVAAGRVEGRFLCGLKHYCREMTSCAEARFYLTQCGVTSLDGNGDGRPCSGVCRRDQPGAAGQR